MVLLFKKLLRIKYLVLLVFVTGCVNPFSKFYVSNLSQVKPEERSQIAKYQGEIEIIRVSPEDLDKEVDGIKSRGYGALGYASFNAGSDITDSMLEEQAKAVGASIAVYSVEYTNTAQDFMPLTLPTTQTTYHNGSVYGGGGFATYTGTSTTLGSQTTYVPYSVDLYDYHAVFLNKRPATTTKKANKKEKGKK